MLLLLVVSVPIVEADTAWFAIDSSSIIAAGETITIHLVSDSDCSGWDIYAVAEVDESEGQTILTYPGFVSNIQANAAASIGDAGTIANYQGSLFYVQSGSFGNDDDPALAAGESIMIFDYTINPSWDGSDIIIAPLAAGKTFTFGPDQSATVGASLINIGASWVGIEGVTISPSICSCVGDIDCDGDVDYGDLSILVSQWLQPPGIPSADIAPLGNGDNFVNFLDFAMMAQYYTDPD